ncbi:SDR family oxidoreductase [Oxalobacteraceae bacterium OM1]|nr:SDR family oxidoreductase [Oxalobacteraceae bacterium OM1]
MSAMLQDKVALVTGAGSGIGRAVALAYAAAGARVVVSDIHDARGRQTVDQIVELRGEAIFQHADTSRPEDNAALVQAALDRFGAIHIACNNAGVGGEAHVIGDCPPEEWNRVIGINLSGVFYGMRYQIPAMLRAGGGSIVNIGSILSQVGFREHAPYVAAKHGLLGLARTAALEYASQHIRVNTVGPAFIKTPLLDNLPPQTLDALAALHPVGRLGRPEEIAELVLWLSSDKASFVNGAYYAADGGYLSQ